MSDSGGASGRRPDVHGSDPTQLLIGLARRDGGDLPLGGEPPGEAAWSAILDLSGRQRMVGLLAAAVAAGAVAVTPAQASQARLASLQWRSYGTLLERHLADLVARLERHDIDYRILKGPAIAQIAYHDPGLRPFGDLDLLVPEPAYEQAVRLITEAGFARRFPELRRGFDRRFGKGTTLVNRAGDEVDLHRTLAPGAFGLRVRTDDLFASADTVALAGRAMRTLDPAAHLVHACYHALLGGARPPLITMVDIARLLAGEVDEERVRRLAERWRGEAVVAEALSLAARTFGLAQRDGLVGWALRYRPDRADRAALHLARGEGGSYARQAIASLSTIRGWRARVAFVVSMLFPTPAAVHHYERGYLQWWWRGGRSLLRRHGAPRPAVPPAMLP